MSNEALRHKALSKKHKKKGNRQIGNKGKSGFTAYLQFGSKKQIVVREPET